MKLFATLSALLFVLASYAQSTLFKVITSSGTIEVVTKTFGRKNSKAYKENKPVVMAKFEELETKFETIKGEL